MPSTCSELTPDNASALYEALLTHLQQEEWPLQRHSSSHVSIELDGMGFSLRHDGVRLLLGVNARDASNLYFLRESAAAHVADIDPQAAAAMTWSRQAGTDATADAAGISTQAAPANFSPATVQARQTIVPGLHRVIVAVADAARFTGAGLHLKLLLPNPEPRAERHTVRWPTVAVNGITRWPEREHALHVRYYTPRDIDVRAGRIALDIVDHPGGRVCGWARATPHVGETVGLMGPAGAAPPALPDGALIAGDMTALPAIARTLDGLPAGHRLRVIAACPDLAALQAYLGPVAGRHELHAVPAGEFDTGLDALLERGPVPDAAWFAGETSTAKRLRQLFKEVWKLPEQARSSSAYWRQERTTDAASKTP